MAIINSSGYRLLNANTVINILKSNAVQIQGYPHIRTRFYDLKKTSDSKILLTVKSQYASNLQRIYDDITKLFATDVLLGGKKVFTTGRPSNVIGVEYILSLQRATSKLEIFFKTQKTTKPKLPEILRPGVLNEEYFVSKINDQVQKINEAKLAVGMPVVFDPNLNLVLFENNRQKYAINGITSIQRVGQELGKSDVRIKTKNGNPVNISLKKQNFSFWSSASKYPAAKEILDYLVKSNLISVSNSSGRGVLTDLSTGKPLIGIRANATVGEIKKYCFGDRENKVDYILIQSFNIGDFKDIRKVGGGQDYKLELNSAVIYKETSNDIIRMKNNVYLTIVPSSDNSSSLMPNYPGFRVQFATNAASQKYYETQIANVPLGRL
jgi:hypothetical protein